MLILNANSKCCLPTRRTRSVGRGIGAHILVLGKRIQEICCHDFGVSSSETILLEALNRFVDDRHKCPHDLLVVSHGNIRGNNNVHREIVVFVGLNADILALPRTTGKCLACWHHCDANKRDSKRFLHFLRKP